MDDTALIQKALEIETEFFDKLNNQKWSHPKEEVRSLRYFFFLALPDASR
jgi:hypothetical protein